MVKSAYYRKAIKQLFPNYICPTHTDWLFFSYWVSSLILSSLLVMPLPLLLSPLIPPLSLSLTPCSSSCTLTPSSHSHSPLLPLHTLLFPPLSNRCILSRSPSLLMFWRWHTLQKPHDLWHCLVGQLLFPSLINFDVEPNEIRQLIKAAADSGLIYSCAWHPSKWQKLMRRSLCLSLGLREVQNCSSAVHQLLPETASASPACSAETLHITAQWLAAGREPPSFSVSDSLLLLSPAPFF